MTNLKKGAIALVIALFFMLLGAIVSYFPIKGHFQAQIEGLKPEVIECIKTDTITAYFPYEIERRVLVHDTIKIALVDTLILRDTLMMPREQKVYGDSSYRAVVSGIEPRLDSISIYQTTITKIATQKEWRKLDYGVQAGVGLVCPINSTPNLGGYIGFGLTYHF